MSSHLAVPAESPVNPYRRGNRPLLLVSVRDAAEAVIALDAGVDLIDVKEPAAGPLGRAPSAVLEEIAQQIPKNAPPIMTAALGETVDVLRSDPPVGLPDRVSLAKLGLSQLSPVADWDRCWDDCRRQISEQRSCRLDWAAVAYADSHQCQAPTWQSVLTATLERPEVRGLLFDTWSKTGPGLVDLLTLADLQQARCRLHDDGKFLALAGRLKLDDLPRLREVAADIIAVRSAACTGFDRRSRIDAGQIAKLIQQLH